MIRTGLWLSENLVIRFQLQSQAQDIFLCISIFSMQQNSLAPASTDISFIEIFSKNPVLLLTVSTMYLQMHSSFQHEIIDYLYPELLSVISISFIHSIETMQYFKIISVQILLYFYSCNDNAKKKRNSGDPLSKYSIKL